MSKLTNREKNIVGFLLIILSTLPFFYLTLPSWNKFSESNSQIKNNQKRLTDLEIQIRKLENLKKESSELQKKIDNQKLYLAKSYEIDFLVEDLKKICDESLVSLDSFTPSNSEPINIVIEKQLESETQGKVYDRGKIKQTFEKLKSQDLPIDLYRFPIEVKVTGNFTDILELFKKLEKYGRVISVDNISIGKIQAKKAFENRLTKSKTKQQKTDTGSLYSSFDLIAYTAARSDEKLPYTQLKKSIGGTDKFSIRAKKRK